MKKLFYLLLMLPLMLAACAEMPTTEIEPQPTPTPEPEPTPVPETFNHGTSAQRSRWLKKGFTTGDIEQGDTFSPRYNSL